MDLIAQVQTTEAFERRMSIEIGLPCADAMAYFTDAGKIVQWYERGQLAWIDDVDHDIVRFSIGDDYETEWECLERQPTRLVLRQRIENSPPLRAELTFVEAGTRTQVEAVLSGEMSVFWKEKFMHGWQGIEQLAMLHKAPTAP